MLVKFFGNKGGGSAKASMDYLLGKNKMRDGAEILIGNPELSVAIAEGLDFKNKYTVGCLSFEETNIDETIKKEVIERFEKTLFAGLEVEQYNITWIQHTDKGRLELNFFIPNVELSTNKRLQPYYDKADRWLIDSFKHVINHQYGFSDPNDPERQQTLSKSYYESKDRRELKEVITEHLEHQIEQGRIKDRQEVLSAIKGMGLIIAREIKQSISIANPEGGLNIRLKGAIYEQNFRFDEEAQERIRERATDYKNRNEERYNEFYSQLERGISQRQKINTEKYPKLELIIDTHRDINSSDYGIRISDMVAEQQIRGIKRSQRQIATPSQVPESQQNTALSEQRRYIDNSRTLKQRGIMEEQRQSRYQDTLKKLLEKSNELLERARTKINRIAEKFGYSTERERRIKNNQQIAGDGMQQANRNQQRIGESQSKITEANRIKDSLMNTHQGGMHM